MIRKLLLVFFAIVSVNMLFAQSGTLKGKVLEKETGEPIPFANVSILKNGKVITGGTTDFDGKFTIKPIPSGKVTVRTSSMGFSTIVLNNVQIVTNSITFKDFKLPSSVKKIPDVIVKSYRIPLIKKDQVASGGLVTAEDIDKMPGRSITQVAQTVGGVSDDGSGNLNVRGARSEGTVYYVDGIKVMGNSLPKSAIEQVNVITGGISARYGDATGGIVSVTTKGAAKEFGASVEGVTSMFLDGYGYNLLSGTLMGPIYSRTEPHPADSTKTIKVPVIGYLVAGEINYTIDPNPSAVGVWVAKDSVREQILQAPMTLTQEEGRFIINNTADYYHDDKFENIKAKPNNASFSVNLQGKIDYNINKNLIATLGGRFRFIDRDLFSGNTNSLFNTDNNAHYRYNNWQVYGKILHKLVNQTPEEQKKSASIFKNVYYQLTASYEKSGSATYDGDYKDDLFKYGHVGKFVTYETPTYQLMDKKSGIYEQNGFADTLVTFTPSEYNKDLARYTEYYYEVLGDNRFAYRNKTTMENMGAVLNGKTPSSIYALYNAPGTPYNGYNMTDNNQYTFSGQGFADLGDHEIQIGFEFEQRDQRAYGASPVGLWERARQLANFHLQNLDKNNPQRSYVVNSLGDTVYQDTIKYDRLYSPSSQTMFDYEFRNFLHNRGDSIDGEVVTVDGTQRLDVDAYDPSDLSINYFSADELINEGNQYVSYFGYDAYGKKISGSPSLDDFFNATNEKGYKTRPLDAFRPNYFAFFIQDKFSFDDLVFRVGLRMDRYDANQKVLADPYSLHNTYKVRDLKANHPDLIENLPSNIGDDYVVYADNTNIEDATSVLGYRIGDNPANIKWYDATGTQVDDPIKVSAATGISPLLIDPDEELNSSAFKDYLPKWNLMPRISFSFPISDVALFSAHYDVLTQRPYDNRLNPIQYLHLQKFSGDPISNPNLTSPKTIEYELGFQQKVSDASSIKISAFYREMRDQRQVQNMTGAYPYNYITYQNIDFGTVKGLTVAYDLRRTGNIRLTLNYTLQFANGTGSDASTALSLIKQGEPNLRATLPLNYDQRHAIKAVVDYSYTEGKNYNGPVLMGRDILQNTGATVVFSYNSGTPYSKLDPNTEYLLGSMNGSRMPDVYRTDMKIYRNITLKKGDKETKKRPMFLQVYLNVFNVFNVLNIRSVYRYTGNANDDAYLTTAKNQPAIEASIDPIAYANYYSMNLDRYWMYYAPRTIRLGATLSF